MASASTALNRALNDPLTLTGGKEIAVPTIKQDILPKEEAVPDMFEGMSYVTEPTRKAYQSVKDLQSKKTEAETILKREEADVENKVLLEKAKVVRKSQENQKALYDQATKDEWSIPAFNPKKNNFMEIGKLFSIIATSGIMLGGEGKLSSLRAMNAMTGMLKGYDAGDKADYQRNYQIYTENVNRMKEHNAQIIKHLENSLKLEATDKEAALIEKEQSVRLAGSSSILAKQIESGRTIDALETAKSAAKALLENDHKIEQARIAHEQAMEKAKFDRETQLMVANTKSQQSGGGSQEGARQRILGSMIQAADSVQSITQLPVTTTGTVWGPKDFTSIYTMPLSALNNKMSNKTSQEMMTRTIGLARNLASIETLGAATGLTALTQSIQDQISMGAGIQPIVALGKLAEIRRIVESGAKVVLANPNYSEEQKQLVREAVAGVQKTIPITQEDISKIHMINNGQLEIPEDADTLTFATFMKQYKSPSEDFSTVGTAQQPAATTTTQPAAGQIATEASIQATMDATKLSRAAVLKALKERGYQVPAS